MYLGEAVVSRAHNDQCIYTEGVWFETRGLGFEIHFVISYLN